MNFVSLCSSLVAFAGAHSSIERLTLFGSYARGEAHEDSDVDVVVVFVPGSTPRGMAGFAYMDDLERALANHLRCPVHLIEQEALESQTPQASGTSSQPSTNDLTAFLRSILPPTVRAGEVKSDPPVPMPNTSPAERTWLINAKVVLTPAEDLLGLPSAEDARAVDALVDELNGLIDWRNAFAKTPYAHTYPAFEIKAPASSVPQLLVVKQTKDKPLPPIYGKTVAEWQVDHWKFTNYDMDMPADLGRPRSTFAGSTMIKGSPEAEAFMAAERRAIAQAKEKKSALESRYAADLLQATKPGTVYRGQITHHLGTLPVTVRFTEQSSSGEPRTASFEVTGTNDASYRFTYTARLQVPIPVGLPQKSTVSEESFRIPVDASPSPANLIIDYKHGEGKEAGNGLQNFMLRGHHGPFTPHGLPLTLSGDQLQGLVTQYLGDGVLSAQRGQ